MYVTFKALTSSTFCNIVYDFLSVKPHTGVLDENNEATVATGS